MKEPIGKLLLDKAKSHKSLRSAAAAWGIPCRTLHNWAIGHVPSRLAVPVVARILERPESEIMELCGHGPVYTPGCAK